MPGNAELFAFPSMILATMSIVLISSLTVVMMVTFATFIVAAASRRVVESRGGVRGGVDVAHR